VATSFFEDTFGQQLFEDGTPLDARAMDAHFAKGSGLGWPLLSQAERIKVRKPLGGPLDPGKVLVTLLNALLVGMPQALQRAQAQLLALETMPSSGKSS
jgi:hypothetical protein